MNGQHVYIDSSGRPIVDSNAVRSDPGADVVEQRYPYSLGTIANCPECNAAFPNARLDEDMDFIVLNHATHRLRDRHKADVAAEMARFREPWA